MSIKKYIKLSLLGALGLTIIISILYCFPMKNIERDGIIEYQTKTEGKQILLSSDGKWQPFEIKGVNLGAGKPGYFPNDFGITKAEYLRWFEQIAEMNANVIRVYTILAPEFYEALYEFNEGRAMPLYLIHGMWVNDNDVHETMNAYDNRILSGVSEDVKTLIDVIHGNAYLFPNNTHASGRYTNDISEYVLGIILGIEWEGYFVHDTDLFNEHISSYEGEYVYLEEGTAFEAFLAKIGDLAVRYESEKYEEQRLIAFSNWPPTDPLDQPSETHDFNDCAKIDVDRIKGTDLMLTGMFASYHIYPNYPNFFNLEPRLLEYRDEQGQPNSYRAYLKEINEHHEIPVVVTEFGVPSSRGIAHYDRSRGFDQGNLSEHEQAEMISAMYADIVAEEMAGAIVFAWQDEWFKSSWNTKELVDSEYSVFWHDTQTNEQYYGLLSFDSVTASKRQYPDGMFEEWSKNNLYYSDELVDLHIDSNEEYLFLKVKYSGYNKSKHKLYIPIDVTPRSGSKTSSQFGLTFDRGVDFIVEIDGEHNSRMVIHEYYDYLSYNTKELPTLNQIENKKWAPDMDSFNDIYQFIEMETFVLGENKKLAEEFFKSGTLMHGNANPEQSGYNSLTDYHIEGNQIEIRIPWQLLNFVAPSKRQIAGDYAKEQLPDPLSIGKLYCGLIVTEEDKILHTVASTAYKLTEWKKPQYIERLKEAYYAVQQMYR